MVRIYLYRFKNLLNRISTTNKKVKKGENKWINYILPRVVSRFPGLKNLHWNIYIYESETFNIIYHNIIDFIERRHSIYTNDVASLSVTYLMFLLFSHSWWCICLTSLFFLLCHLRRYLTIRGGKEGRVVQCQWRCLTSFLDADVDISLFCLFFFDVWIDNSEIDHSIIVINRHHDNHQPRHHPLLSLKLIFYHSYTCYLCYMFHR